jgi:multicomponent K+:H+ antiporter subunit E
MTRLLPYPLLWAGLTLMWLLLTSFSLGNLILGTIVATIAGQAASALKPERPRLRRLDLIVRLFGRVMADIVRSNIAVARLILTGGPAKSGFVEIPLELRDPTGLAILAIVLTSTPGTAWIDYDSAQGRLLLHVFDLREADDWRDIVKTRYETLLLEILR